MILLIGKCPNSPVARNSGSLWRSPCSGTQHFADGRATYRARYPFAQTIDQIIHQEPARGCSVIFTTHDLEEARAADNVILTAGYVVACGPPDQVLTAANLSTAYGLGLLHPEFSDTIGIIDGGHEESSHHEGQK
jgi:hypothetical protein